MECSKSVGIFIPSALLLFCGYVLGIVGVSSTYWCYSVDSRAEIGLWKFCWNPSKTHITRTCFEFSKRDHVPVMIFVCSALSVICLIVLSFAIIGSFCALCQKRSRMIRWSRTCGILAVLSDCGMALAVSLYAGTFHDINYSIIPKWNSKTQLKLGWSFIVCCTSAVTIFAGAVLAIYCALNEASKSKIIPINSTQLAPSLTLHPPPSSRSLSPFHFNSQPRVMSPLPFSRSKFLSKSMNSSPRETRSPVFMH